MPVKPVGDHKVLCMAWNLNKEEPLLAVAVEGRAVMILTEEGGHYEDVVIRTREGNSEAVQLSWSPMTTASGGLLAIG